MDCLSSQLGPAPRSAGPCRRRPFLRVREGYALARWDHRVTTFCPPGAGQGSPVVADGPERSCGYQSTMECGPQTVEWGSLPGLGYQPHFVGLAKHNASATLRDPSGRTAARWNPQLRTSAHQRTPDNHLLPAGCRTSLPGGH